MEDKKLVYEVPQITTYTDVEILEELGPAQTKMHYDDNGAA